MLVHLGFLSGVHKQNKHSFIPRTMFCRYGYGSLLLCVSGLGLCGHLICQFPETRRLCSKRQCRALGRYILSWDSIIMVLVIAFFLRGSKWRQVAGLRWKVHMLQLACVILGKLTLYIIFASKHSTSSSSSFSLLPMLIAALNSATVTRVRLTGAELLSLGSSNPPAMNTFLRRFRSAISRPRSRVR